MNVLCSGMRMQYCVVCEVKKMTIFDYSSSKWNYQKIVSRLFTWLRCRLVAFSIQKTTFHFSLSTHHRVATEANERFLWFVHYHIIKYTKNQRYTRLVYLCSFSVAKKTSLSFIWNKIRKINLRKFLSLVRIFSEKVIFCRFSLFLYIFFPSLVDSHSECWN